MYESWEATVARLVTLRVPMPQIRDAIRTASVKGRGFADRLDGSGLTVRYAVERAPIAGPSVKFQVREVIRWLPPATTP